MTDEALAYPVPNDISLLPVLRAMARCQTNMELLMGRYLDPCGVTPTQFDVLATLGDSEPIPTRELGERSLVSRGTLTSVLDRMEAKGWLVRQRSPHDSRSILVGLTPEGQAVYERLFLPYVRHMRGLIAQLTPEEQTILQLLTDKLARVFGEALVPPT